MCNVKLSVVIPVYNAEKTLSKCVKSICAQDLREIEVLCVDDHSSDSSLSLLEEMAAFDDRIVVLHNEKNEGTLMARKRGVMAAQGEYIMFADDDDWYDPNCFTKLYMEIKEKQTDILMYGFRPVTISVDDRGEVVEERHIWFAVPEEEIYHGDNCLAVSNRINLLWNKVVKADICKRAYANAKDIFLTIAEDTYSCLLIHYYAKSFAAITDVCYNWNCTDGESNNSSGSLKRFYNICECMDRYEKAYSDFLIEHDEKQLLDDFNNRNTEVGYDFCVDMWRKIVATEDAHHIDKIISIYGENKVFSYIHKQLNELESSREAMGAEIERLYEVERYLHTRIESLSDKNKNLKQKVDDKNKKIESLKSEIKNLRESTSFKVGKVVTAVPRKMKKLKG